MRFQRARDKSRDHRAGCTHGLLSWVMRVALSRPAGLVAFGF